MAQQTIAGNMALIYVNNALVGIFDSVNYSTNIGTEPVFILGRSTAAEIAITHQEIATLNCSGFRVAGAGPYTLPAVPLVQNLLTFEPFTITVVNRQSGNMILTVANCVPNSYAGNHNARATSKVQISYQGTIIYDESGTQDEPGDAASLP